MRHACLAAALAALFTTATHSRESLACGAFASSKAAGPAPYLAVERVLLLWDQTTGVEDFIREARFDRASRTFGFVVPVPSMPEVSAVAAPPFKTLQKSYPFTTPEIAMQKMLSAPMGGGGGGRGAKKVEVLAEQKVGSFTAFTLAASDADALRRWLADNGFVMSPEATPWAKRNVAARVFFVAFRYDAKSSEPAAAGDAGISAMTSETVRIRFRTPNPYYPYAEPFHPDGDDHARRLDGWLVTREPMVPVAARAQFDDKTRSWERPVEAGIRHRPSAEEFAAALGEDLARLLPRDTPLVVQTFEDEKSSRYGFGDMIFVPEKGAPAKPDEAAARRVLLPLVDPTLVDERWPSRASWRAAVPAPPSARCNSGAVGARSTEGVAALAIAVLVGIGLRRRSGRPRAAALLVAVSGLALVPITACARPKPVDGEEADAGVVLPSRAEREATALAILAGDNPGGVVKNAPPWEPWGK